MSYKIKYGITDAKKNEIDALESKIITAQNTVKKLQAIVTSLTDKLNNIDVELAARDQNKTKALDNKNMLDAIISQVKDVFENSKNVKSQIEDSSVKIKVMAANSKILIDKLIYTVETFNKLSNLIIRKKALNPLISDELINLITKTGTDANNAISLILVALTSVFDSQTATMEAEATIDLENSQAENLYTLMTQQEIPQGSELLKKNMQILINEVYKDSLTQYTSTLHASNDVSEQLRNATADLDKAKAYLKSLELAISAANAAALAS